MSYLWRTSVGLTVTAGSVFIGNKLLQHKTFGTVSCSAKEDNHVLPAGPPAWENGVLTSSQGSDLKLTGVYVFFRHGARTPLRHVCMDEVEYDAKVLKRVDPELQIQYRVSGLKGEQLTIDKPHHFVRRQHILMGGTETGILTHVGRKQCFELGKRLRQRYIVENNFLPEHFCKKSVYVRSTEMHRTVDSVTSLLAGMYSNTGELAEPIEIVISPIKKEILFPNFMCCGALKESKEKALKYTETQSGYNFVRNILKKSESSFQQDNANRKETINVLMNPCTMDNSGMEGLWAWLDHVIVRETHKLTVPVWLSSMKKVMQIEAVKGLEPYTSGLPQDRERILRLSAGPMLNLVLESMQNILEGKTEAKMHLYSGHDTTLVPLLVSLGIFKQQWPPYASELRFELYQEESTKKAFVRVLFQDKPVVLEKCQSAIIPYETFRDVLNAYAVSPGQYTYECLVTERSLSNFTEEQTEDSPSFLNAADD